MDIEKQNLIKEIDYAFFGVTLGAGIGLWQAQGIDDYESDERILKLREKDEKNDWHNVSHMDINRCGSSPSFFDGEGMRFYLPAMMVYELDRDESEDLSFDGPDVIFHLCSSVSGDSCSEKQFSLLNESQIRCVINFMRYALKKIVESSQKYRDANGNALDSYYDFEYEKLEKAIQKWESKLVAK